MYLKIFSVWTCMSINAKDTYCLVGPSSSVLVSSQQRIEMTNSYSSSRQDLLCKQYTFDTLRVGHPTGVALSWFGFPLLYPLFPPLRGSWGLIGYTLCRYGITCMCPRPAGKGTCFLGNGIAFRTGDTFGIFSHQRFPVQSMAYPFCRLFCFSSRHFL